ncbi:MAG: putative branched-chain amino acid transporter permease protein [Frankiales bacterium]|nr:putative branched-chain amino acid transporter permease protein [Frankiales bacterium]
MTAAGSSYRRAVGSQARVVALAGAVLLVVGSVLPWARFSGFPGKMTLAGPGGARIGPLLLALVAALLLRQVPGSARAVRAASTFAFLITGLTVFFIGYSGGGADYVNAGAWVALAGALVYLLGGLGLDPSRPASSPPRSLPDAPWALPAEWLLTAGSTAVALYVFVHGLGIQSANVGRPNDVVIRGAISINALTNDGEFLAFLLLLIGLALVATRLGLLADLSAITKKHPTVFLAAGMIAATAFPFTQNGNGYALRIAASIGVFAAAAVGLNIVVGLAGLLDLGYIAFFGVGAYVAALVSGSVTSTIHTHIPFVFVIFLGAAVAGLFGILLGAPTLRLRGDYLAIVTLGFGEIFRITANNLDGNSGPSLTNGPNGVSNIPDLTIGSFSFGDNHHFLGVDLPFQANYYWLEIVVLVVVMTAFLRLSESRIGRAWVAIREDELAAAATGINTTRLKLLAFALGATLAGAAGTVDAHVVKVATPDSFTFLESALLLAAVILGGMGTVPGALVGATILYLIPEKLRFLQDLRLLVFGVVLVLIMRFRPEGLIPSSRRKREFHDDSGGADALSMPPGHGEHMA